MKDVSVLIPTAKRPDLLHTALESVDRQTEIARIGEVVVIENGEDRGSADVCKRFPNLPIRYLYRNPTVSAWAGMLPRRWRLSLLKKHPSFAQKLSSRRGLL